MARQDFAAALRGVRDGDVGFADVAIAHRGLFVSLARSELQRWPPSHVTIDDLVQEGLVMCWRAAVDYWDPSRGVALDRYVMFRVARYIRRVMLKASGWPVKGRSAPARPVRMTDEIEIAHNVSSATCAIDRVEVGQAVDACTTELGAVASIGVVLGMDAAAVALHLYNDPSRRLRYRFDSVDNARHKVRRAVDLAAHEIAALDISGRV